MVKSKRQGTQMREQEAGLVAAAVSVLVEKGFGDLTVEEVVDRAEVPRSTFDSRFAGKQAVVEFAYETLFEQFLGRLSRAIKTQPSWPLKVKVGVGATLDMAAAEPVKAQFLTLDTLATNKSLVHQRFESRERLARLLAAGRTEILHGAELPGVVEQTLIAGIAWVISSQLRNGEAEQLPALAPQLVELTLTPYLGREEAAKMARRPRPIVGEDD
jgi:AcrR family transcriptional regulator